MTLGICYSLRGSCSVFSVLSFAIFAALCFISLILYLSLPKAISRIAARTHALGPTEGVKSPMCVFTASLAALTICWLPYLISTFPGLFVYDAITQTVQTISLHQVNSWHTLIHTFWLCKLMEFGKETLDSYEAGFSIYTISQYLLYALTISLAIKRLAQLNAPKLLLTLSIAFFALFPIFPIMAVSSTKDTLFSGLFFLFCVDLLLILAKGNQASCLVEFTVTGLLLCCFRNNAFYVVAVLTPLFLIVSKERQIKLLYSAIVILGFILAIVIPKAVSQYSSGPSEILSIPMQQVCRAATKHKNKLTKNEIEKLDTIVPAWRNYNPAITDPVKFADNTAACIENQMDDFFKLWASLLLKHPSDYLDAIIGLTNNWVNPLARYQQELTNQPYLQCDSYEIYSPDQLVRRWPDHKEYVSYDTSLVIPIKQTNLFPPFKILVRAICYGPIWEANPILRVLTSPATICWFILLACFVALEKKRPSTFITVAFILLYFLTCLLGPVYLVRYALPFYQVIPLLIYILQSLVTIESKNKRIGKTDR